MTSFKLFAGTNVGLRENNEDNFTVCKDLTQNEWVVPDGNQQAFPLGERGCLMVVADGMGGQNAGEVASAIAIATVQEFFAPENLPADILDTPASIKNYLRKTISETDLRVKAHARSHPETNGMGSTIVMAWVIEAKVYVAWLGDSRAYSFIPNKGIARLSKDHSYVQKLVDAGTITDEEAMNHPNSNIITRSLGDTSQKAKADVAEFPIEDGEVILLCSDGLCGVCKDEEIGGIIEDNANDLQQCKEKLTTAALAAGGSDNITISLMQVFTDKQPLPENEVKSTPSKTNILTNSLFLCVATLLLCGLGFAAYTLIKKPGVSNDPPTQELSIKLELDKTEIKGGEVAKYNVVLSDTTEKFHILFDKNLLVLNQNRRTLHIASNAKLFNDTTTYIKAVCVSDTSKSDKVALTLKPLIINDNVTLINRIKELGVKTEGSEGESESGSENTDKKGAVTTSSGKEPPKAEKLE